MNVHIEDTQKNVDNREIFKRYQDYKQTSLDWLDQIPDHWNEIKAKWACDKITDGSHHSPSEDKSGDRIYITVNDIEDDTINFDGAKRISDEDFRELEKGGCRPNSGDVLLSKDGTIGKSLVVESNNFVVLSSIAILRPSNRFHPKFVKYFCDSKFCLEQMKSRLKGSALTRITLELIKEFDYLYPPKEEQKAIVHFLDQKTEKIDRLIEQKERLIELLEEKLISKLDALIDQDGDDWNQVHLNWITSKIGSGLTPDGGAENYLDSGVLFLRSQNIHKFELKTESPTFISKEIHDSMNNSKVESGDVLLNITGASIGRAAIVPDSINEANVNQHVCIIRPQEEYIRPEFLNLVMNSPYLQHQINSQQLGSSREGLNYNQVGELSIPLPASDDVQAQIVEHYNEFYSDISKLIERVNSAIGKLKEYRKALISHAVTGKIDVREEVDAY